MGANSELLGTIGLIWTEQTRAMEMISQIKDRENLLENVIGFGYISEFRNLFREAVAIVYSEGQPALSHFGHVSKNCFRPPHFVGKQAETKASELATLLGINGKEDIRLRRALAPKGLLFYLITQLGACARTA